MQRVAPLLSRLEAIDDEPELRAANVLRAGPKLHIAQLHGHGTVGAGKPNRIAMGLALGQFDGPSEELVFP